MHRKWTRVQILDKAGCISRSANTLGEGCASNYPLSMGKIVGKTELFNLGMATGLREGKTEFKSVKLRLKIDLKSHPLDIFTIVNSLEISTTHDVMVNKLDYPTIVSGLSSQGVVHTSGFTP